MKSWLKRLLKHPRTIHLLAWIIAKYIGFVFRTTRWQKMGWEHPEAYWKQGKPFLTCFWHNRLLMVCFAWQGPSAFHMLISAHSDGQLIAQTVAHYGIATIAGSSSKGGSAALRTILKALKQGQTVGFTPDGPRGPRFQASQGIAAAARLSELDILPVTFSTTRRYVLNSWDRFVLALPFGRGILAWGKPIKFSEWPSHDLDIMAKTVAQELTQLCDMADNLCGHQSLR